MERLQRGGGGGKRSLRSRKRKHPPEKPANEEAQGAAAAAAADGGTSECVDTSFVSPAAQLSFVDDAPEEVGRRESTVVSREATVHR